MHFSLLWIFPLCFSTSMINLAIRDDSDAMNQVQASDSCIESAGSVQGTWPYHVWDNLRGQSTLTSITLERTDLKPCARCHCVCLVMTHRLICDMSYLSHSSGQVIWTDPRSDFKIHLFCPKWYLDASRRKKYDGINNFPLPSLVEKSFAKMFILLKNNNFGWPALERSKCD